MEIKCQHCEHIGAPASMKPKGNSIELTCSSCGKINRIEGEGDEAPVQLEAREDQFQNLLPKKAEGPRCPKCLTPIDGEVEDNCRICGLDLSTDYSHLPYPPWESSPKGKEAEYEQALLLWSALEENPNETGFEKFVKFTNTLNFHDLQIRKLRHFLVHSPDNQHALKYLKKQSDQIQTRLIVAQTQSQGRTQELGSRLQHLRQKILIGVAIALFVLILVFANFIYA